MIGPMQSVASRRHKIWFFNSKVDFFFKKIAFLNKKVFFFIKYNSTFGIVFEALQVSWLAKDGVV